ncbi:MAG TPA: KGK domain-containing protein, partial [Candidatus Sericytochromatia bacterium]
LDCQFLKVGSKGWEKGKIRIKVSYEFENNIIRVRLEFSPDEPPQPESPLDDLRELPEYKQQI